MKPIPRRKHFSFFTGLMVTMGVFLSSIYYGAALPARAEPSPSVPGPSADFYYNDQANLLSDVTKALILTKNAELTPQSVQLVVLTMDTLPVTGYTQRVEYLRTVMQSWQVGGQDGTGLLLAVSVSDQDYIAVAGEGLQSLFTTDLLKSLLDSHLEPDFSTGAYDSGIAKFVTEAASLAQAWAPASNGEPAVAKPEQQGGGVPVLLWVALAAGGVAVICIAVFILSGRSGRRRYGSRRMVHRHAPLVTPPRTNVMRHESRTPMLVKSSNRGGGPSRIKKL